MERGFAGFWRDGAKVQPGVSHCDRTSYVVAMEKKTGEYFCKTLRYPGGWSEFYWLDTTTPEQPTPQEAFELLKMIFPMLTGIEKERQRDYTMKGDRYTEANINWGDTREYPPKNKWRVPTDTDKGKECRCKHRHDDEWKYGRVFITEFEGKFLAKVVADNSKTSYAMCEVLDE